MVKIAQLNIFIFQIKQIHPCKIKINFVGIWNTLFCGTISSNRGRKRGSKEKFWGRERLKKGRDF
jgi:hypothetical protein